MWALLKSITFFEVVYDFKERKRCVIMRETRDSMLVIVHFAQ